MALDVSVKEEEAAPTTRQTTPGGRAAASLGVAGYNQYGSSPMFGRLPYRGLNGFDLSTLDLLQVDPLAAIELLPLIFPDASLAVHNILRLGNPGWSINCYHAKSGKEDRRASRLCREMMEKANRGVDCDIPGAMGGPDSLINALLFNAYLKGAVAVETVLDETLTNLEDIVAVDPFSIVFEERKEKRGRYRIFQMQGGDRFNTGGKPTVAPVPTMASHEGGNAQASLFEQKVELNPNLFTYTPLDETLYGRSMVAPALQLLIFWTRFYIALQVFLHNVAFGEKDGEIDTALLLTLLDRNMTGPERKKWERDFWGELKKLVTSFAEDYKLNAKRDPNSALIHSDLLKMSSLGTAKTAYPVKEVMEVCKREIYAALKMLPVLMGANDTTTETHATIQMQVFVSGLNYIQGAVKHVIERALLTGLRALGYARDVRVELAFTALSLEDRAKVAEAIALELENEAFKRNQGWITQDEASENATGSPAVMDGPSGEPAATPLFVRQTPAPPAPGEGAEGDTAGGGGTGGDTEEEGDATDAARKPRRRRRGRSAMGGDQLAFAGMLEPAAAAARGTFVPNPEIPDRAAQREAAVRSRDPEAVAFSFATNAPGKGRR